MFRTKHGKRISILALLVCIAFIGLVVTPYLSAQKKAQAKGRVDVTVNKPFDTTLDALKAGIKASQLMVISEINHQKMQMMIGNQIKGSTNLEFFRPDLGKSIFANDPRAALEVPLRLGVTERSANETSVSYYKPSALLEPYDGLNDLGKTLDDVVEKIVDSAK